MTVTGDRDADPENVSHTITLDLRPDPALPQPYDGALAVRTSDTGQLELFAVIRPDLDEVAQGRVADWVMGRIQRLLQPRPGVPDFWTVARSGYRYAYHLPLPDDAPHWTDLLL